MARDFIYNGSSPSMEFSKDPFGDYYSFESRDYIFSKSRAVINNAEILTNIAHLNSAKTAFGIGNVDKIIKLSEHEFDQSYGKKISYDASSFFVTAKNYLVNAKGMDLDIMPVLHYYGFMFFHSSLSNLFYKTVSRKETHGLVIKWPQGIPDDNKILNEKNINNFLNEIEVEILPWGSFARARDFYSINNKFSLFSLITKDPTNNSIITNVKAIVTNNPIKIKLKDLLNFKYSPYHPGSYDLGSSEILFDYIGFFIVSSLARYRPTMWRQVCSGIGDLFADILGMYRRTIDYYCFIHELLEEKTIIESVYSSSK